MNLKLEWDLGSVLLGVLIAIVAFYAYVCKPDKRKVVQAEDTEGLRDQVSSNRNQDEDNKKINQSNITRMPV